jgi:hypothetical protein
LKLLLLEQQDKLKMRIQHLLVALSAIATLAVLGHSHEEASHKDIHAHEHNHEHQQVNSI